MLNELIHDLKNLNAKNPVLAWSGGKDSTFLLHLMLELGLKFSVLTLPHLWNKEQFQFVKDMIGKHKLSVFFYSPLAVNYTSPHVTVDYRIGGVLVKKVMDHVYSTRCGLDAGREAIAEQNLQPYYIWDATVVGTKRTDHHDLVESFDFRDTDGHRFIKPLWDWTDAQVLDTAEGKGYQLDKRAGPEGDTGNFIACMDCLDTKDNVYCPKLGKTIRGIK